MITLWTIGCSVISAAYVIGNCLVHASKSNTETRVIQSANAIGYSCAHAPLFHVLHPFEEASKLGNISETELMVLTLTPLCGATREADKVDNTPA